MSSSLGVSAAGGATSSGYTCGGAAGTVYVVNGTTSSLIFDNSDGSSDSSTCTLFPPELSGVQLRQLSILRKACVDLRQSVKNNDVRAYLLDIDGSSKMTGDGIVIDTCAANLRGQITCTSALQLHNAQSGVGLVTAYTGSSMTCSSCTVKMSLTGSHVMLQGTVSASTLEITGVERISLAGSLTANASELAIAAGSANISGTATCSGSACSIRVSVNTTLEVGGTVRCSGNNQCLVDVVSGWSALVGGSITGSDIRMVIAGSLQVIGTITASGQGYAESAGDGKGNRSSYTSSASSDSFRVSGSGGGHGGNGANSCYQYASGYGTTASGGGSYGSSIVPRTFGSGGGRSCYSHSDCRWYGAGGSGGGRILMNASLIEIAIGAIVSADGTSGGNWSGGTIYGSGGAGSGGSILIEPWPAAQPCEEKSSTE